MVLTRAQAYEATQEPCIAELEAIKHLLVEAKQQSVQEVEMRVDVKSMMAWLQ